MAMVVSVEAPRAVEITPHVAAPPIGMNHRRGQRHDENHNG